MNQMSTLTGTAHNPSTLAGALPALTVMVEKDLEVLVHRFLARKRDDLDRARAALAAGDFETIRRIGHDLKGAGEGFGFPELSAFGAALERAAVLHNERALGDELVAVDQFLSRLRITFK
jgi:HPt (histidine-containing phosphotransfer) domain-containing protein